jgi:hypothetical protein
VNVTWDPTRYGKALADLVQREALPELGPGSPNRPVEPKLRSLSLEALFSGQRIVDPDMARGCLAGLWLLHDFLDESHAISQEIETPTGSYWHGMMHRREPDYGNSKYWFRGVGQHPVFAPLVASVQADPSSELQVPDVAALGSHRTWDPFRFVDLCERAARVSGPLSTACRTIALREWQLLFEYCFDQAIGASHL